MYTYAYVFCYNNYVDALSVYLTSPSTPTGGGTSSELSTSVNLYLASGDGRPSWIQVCVHACVSLSQWYLIVGTSSIVLLYSC